MGCLSGLRKVPGTHAENSVIDVLIECSDVLFCCENHLNTVYFNRSCYVCVTDITLCCHIVLL